MSKEFIFAKDRCEGLYIRQENQCIRTKQGSAGVMLCPVFIFEMSVLGVLLVQSNEYFCPFFSWIFSSKCAVWLVYVIWGFWSFGIPQHSSLFSPMLFSASLSATF